MGEDGSEGYDDYGGYGNGDPGATGNDSTGYDKLITVYGAGALSQVASPSSDPFGWGVQFDYPMMSPPAEMPFYTTTCKSNDGCSGQGFCDKL